MNATTVLTIRTGEWVIRRKSDGQFWEGGWKEGVSGLTTWPSYESAVDSCDDGEEALEIHLVRTEKA